ncbi:unnamed protein product [Spirodela intermedia]|uniref:Uncharacterized protein n=1 Tax=Spirodela intermedia TaxID=51605 RepID=A0A7I8LG95_SPIIN|nr:unnamed protein product [Spirodela intermedia]
MANFLSAWRKPSPPRATSHRAQPSPFLFTAGFSVIFLLLAAGCDGAPFTNRKGGKSSVFSLFNLKSKSKFWSEKVIHGDFDDLESSVLSDPAKMGAYNYTKAGNIANYLELSEVVSLYIPVHVNFIFLGFDGQGNHGFNLGPEELERWFTKIDHVFEHTRIPPIGEVLNPFYKISFDKVQRHHLPLVSHINYNFSVHAINMGQKVTSIFEHAIKVFSRRDDITDARDDESVLWQVDIDMMYHLFSSLVDYLQLVDAYNIFILNPRHDAKKVNYGYRRGLSESEINFIRKNKTLQEKIFNKVKSQKPLYVNHPMSKFAWTAAEGIDTENWSSNMQNALNNVETFLQNKDAAEIIYCKASQIRHGVKDDTRLLFEKELKSVDMAGLHAECLTDTWVGRDRWAFADLTLGSFSWGPAVVGEGVRTEFSLPNVGKTIGAVSEATEEEAEDQLQEAIRERFSVFGDDHQAIDILLAEIDIYEFFAFKHCKGRKVKLALCEELDERMRDLKSELQSYDGEEHDESQKKKAMDALRRMENWNLFSDTYEDHQNYTVARDSFLAHLGATLRGSMSHVIAPSTADGAYHYYKKISFQLYFITQEKNIKQLPVNLVALKEGLSSLLWPSQEVLFGTNLLSLSENYPLAMAFSVARRAAAVPLLLVNGTYRSTVRSYLDSSILQHQLQRSSDHGLLKGKHSSSRSTLEVPIFWFIHSDPLFVDKHYQAKGLSDMIIVVQSESPSWESHLQCNNRSLLLDLRMPIKAAIAATAEHIAGLLPPHLVYSPAHETAVEDWMWSVGCSPLSITSHGWQISRFQSDTISRSYIITSLEESIQVVNEAIHLLLMERTTEKGFKVFQPQQRVLVEKYNSVVGLWRRISTISGELEFDNALRLLHILEDASKSFNESVHTAIALLHPIHCTRERKVDVEVDMTTIPAFAVVAAILWFVLRPRRPKAKIN